MTKHRRKFLIVHDLPSNLAKRRTLVIWTCLNRDSLPSIEKIIHFADHNCPVHTYYIWGIQVTSSSRDGTQTTPDSSAADWTQCDVELRDSHICWQQSTVQHNCGETKEVRGQKISFHVLSNVHTRTGWPRTTSFVLSPSSLPSPSSPLHRQTLQSMYTYAGRFCTSPSSDRLQLLYIIINPTHSATMQTSEPSLGRNILPWLYHLNVVHAIHVSKMYTTHLCPCRLTVEFNLILGLEQSSFENRSRTY